VHDLERNRALNFSAFAPHTPARTPPLRCCTDFVPTRRKALRDFRFVLRCLTLSGCCSARYATAAPARTEAGIVLESDAAALAMLSITAFPASNMLSRSNGPLAVTVSRSGFLAEIIFTLVGWQWFHSARLRSTAQSCLSGTQGRKFQRRCAVAHSRRSDMNFERPRSRCNGSMGVGATTCSCEDARLKEFPFGETNEPAGGTGALPDS
jgi:hypothetical protein